MTRILCPEPENFSPEGLDFAARRFHLTSMSMGQSAFEREAPAYDAVLVRFSTTVGAHLLQHKGRLRSVLSPTTGLDHIDMEAAAAQGVAVHHLRGQRAFLRTVTSTAELAFALVLNCARMVPAASGDVAGGAWRQSPFQGMELAGRRLGVLGCGRLGSKVARMGLAFGMRVRFFDERPVRAPKGAERCASLDELLASSDVLSLHVPLNEATRNLIGARELALLPPGAILVNTSRGAIVDEQALIAALGSGRLAGAGLDVLRQEPPLSGTSRELVEIARRRPRLVITPHIGGACREALAKADLHILSRFERSGPQAA